jgi:hypothetical protein
MTTLPQTGATELVSGQATPETSVNEIARYLDASVTRSIIEDRDLTDPPGACADGARYLVASSPTGAWSGEAGNLAIAVGTNASNGWLFQTVAVEGFRLYIRDENTEIEYNGASWATPAGVYTDENARDAIGSALGGGGEGITVTVDDGADTITIAWAGGEVNTSPSDGDVLTWDDGAGEWVAAPAPGSGGGSGGTVPTGGSAGQVLMKDTGVDQDVSWAFSSPVILGSDSTVSSGILEVTGLTLGDYCKVEVILEDIHFSTAGYPAMTFYVAGSEVTTGYYWGHRSLSSSGSTDSANGANAANIGMADPSSSGPWYPTNGTDVRFGGQVAVIGPGSSGHKPFRFFGISSEGSTGATADIDGGGALRNTGAITGFKIVAAVGAIDAGVLTVIGYKRAY